MPVIEKYSDTEINELDNEVGHIIFNTTKGILQINNGIIFNNIESDNNTIIKELYIKIQDIEDKYLNLNKKVENTKVIPDKLDTIENNYNNLILQNNKIPNKIDIIQKEYSALYNKLLEQVTILCDNNKIVNDNLNLTELSTTIMTPKQINITEIGNLKYLNINGLTKINNNQGNCLRLIYNKPNGDETIYSDFNMGSDGSLNINPTGLFIKTDKRILINNDYIGFSQKSSTNVEYITSINNLSVSAGSITNHPFNLITGNKNRVTIDTTGNCGIDTIKPNKNLSINNSNGGGIRLIYNNNQGTEDIYTDYEISSKGIVTFNISNNGNIGIYKFNGGLIDATIYTSDQPNITSLGILSKLNMSGPINNVTTLYAKHIDGTILTNNQPNIQSVGRLNQLIVNSNIPLLYTNSVNHILSVFKSATEKSAALMEIQNSIGTRMVFGIDGNGYTNNDTTSVIISCVTPGDVRLMTNNIDRLRIKDDGLIGINTNKPSHQLTINSKIGHCLRLEYNNNIYSNIQLSNEGKLVIESSGVDFIGGEINAILSKSDQPNITSVGTLSKLDIIGEINGVTNFKALTLTGDILTCNQPNITSLGTLSKLKLSGILTSNIISNTGQIAVFTNDTPNIGAYIEINNITKKVIIGLDSVDDMVIGNYSKGNLKLITNSVEYLRISHNGCVGVNTISTEKQVTINSKTGECLRLIYNNINGLEYKYLDISVLPDGNAIIKPSGNSINISSNLIIGNENNKQNIIKFNNRNNETIILEQEFNEINNSELLLFKSNSNNRIRFKSYEHIFQTITDENNSDDDNNTKFIITNNGNIGINTVKTRKQLNINSITGELIRLCYNNTEDTFLDINMDSNGLVEFLANGDKSGFKFSGGNIDGIIITTDQPNITSLGILSNLEISGKLDVNELKVNILDTTLITQSQPNITSLGDLHYLNINGKLNINEENGNCIRLVFNNTDKYIDLLADTDGNLNIYPVGEYISTTKQFEIKKNGLGFSHKSPNNVEFITSVSDITGVSIGSYSNDSINLITNNMSRITINNNGNVGIGTQNPLAILDLGITATNSLLYLYNNNNNIYGFGVLNNTLLYQSGDSGDHAWFTNSNNDYTGTELMRMVSKTGYLGIGINNPSYPLHIEGFENGIAHSFDNIILNTYINKKNKTAILQTSTNNSLILGSNNKEQLILSTNGNIGIGITDPVGLLHLRDSCKNSIIIENKNSNSTANIQYKTDTCVWELGAKYSDIAQIDSFYLLSGTSDKLTILSNGLTGINTSRPQKQLSINSDTGECLRLINSNNIGAESIYLDLEVSSEGIIKFIASGDSPQFKFVGGSIDCIISNGEQPNITSLGTLTELDITGNITVANVYCDYINGVIITANQPNITSLGELTNLTVSNIINNFNTGGIIVRSYDSVDLTGMLLKEEIISSFDLTNINTSNNLSFEIIGYIRPTYTELYTFNISTTNKIRCWINNKLVYNSWKVNNTDTTTFNIELSNEKWYPIYIQCTNSNNDFTLKWKSESQIIETINKNNLAWDNHIDKNKSRYPLTSSDFIEIYNSGLDKNNTGIIAINDDGNMTLNCTNNIVDIGGYLNATLITPEQPNITSLGVLSKLEVMGNITHIQKLDAQFISGIIETAFQPNITTIGTLTELNIDGNINGVNKLNANELVGTILTPDQLNITSIGELSNLKVTGKIISTELITDNLSGVLLTQIQPNITTLGTLTNLEVDGDVNINNCLIINSNNENCLKLLYNKDKYKSQKFVDFNIDTNGNLTIKPSGKYIKTNNTIQIINDGYGLYHTSLNENVTLYTYITDNDTYIGNLTNTPLHLTTSKMPRITINTNGFISINTTSQKAQLVINNVTGNCMRLVHNNISDNETIYTDLNVDVNGNLCIDTSGNTIYTSSQLRIQSETGIGLSILSPNGLSELITHVINNSIQLGSTTNTSINLITNNINRLNIDNFGNINVFNKLNIISDNNLIKNKENIDNIFCKKFINIEPKKYNKKEVDNNEIYYGYIAQDLINNGFESLTNIINDNGNTLYTISTDNIIPLLSKNIKILYDENKELKERLERLEKLILKEE